MQQAANHHTDLWLGWLYSGPHCSFQSHFTTHITLNHTDNKPSSLPHKRCFNHTLVLAAQAGFGEPQDVGSMAMEETNPLEQALCPETSTATSSLLSPNHCSPGRSQWGSITPVPMSKMLWFPSGFVGPSTMACDAAIGPRARRCGRR